MQENIPVEKSFGQLLNDLGFSDMCEGRRGYSVDNLDSKIIEQHLTNKRTLNFSICVNKKDNQGRSFLTNPGFFIPPDTYYFFKEAKYRPDQKTFAMVVYVIRGHIKKKNNGIKMEKGYKKEMSVEEIRALIAGQAFERYYRAIYSVSEAYTICQ